MTVAVVIVAAGSGRRFGGRTPKQFQGLGGIPLLEWSRRAFASCAFVEQVVLVVPPRTAASPPKWLDEPAITLTAGGGSRRASVRAGLQSVREPVEVVLVHDAARPFVTGSLIERVTDSACLAATIPVLPVEDTIKELDAAGRAVRTLNRDSLARVQTPQGFPFDLLREQHERAAREGSEATDDAALCEEAGMEVRTVDGDPFNIKITTRADFAFAEWVISEGIRTA